MPGFCSALPGREAVPDGFFAVSLSDSLSAPLSGFVPGLLSGSVPVLPTLLLFPAQRPVLLTAPFRGLTRPRLLAHGKIHHITGCIAIAIAGIYIRTIIPCRQNQCYEVPVSFQNPCTARTLRLIHFSLLS